MTTEVEVLDQKGEEQDQKQAKREARQERVKELLERLKEGIAALTSSEDWIAHLKSVVKFGSYSFRNQMLIALQCPHATRVAGFWAWKKLGRKVRKGEKGIAILAPIVVRRRDEAEGEEGVVPEVHQAPVGADPDRKDEARESAIVVGFRRVFVFDVSQTEGQPLATGSSRSSLGRSLVPRLEGQDDAAAAALARLKEYAEEDLGIPVSFEDTTRGDVSGANGYLAWPPPRIVVATGRPPLQQAKTLAHEIGHAILHMGSTGMAGLHDRPVKEVEAESVAFCVMDALGFETDGYSFPYVATWSGGDPEEVTRAGERIQRAVAQVLAVLLDTDEAGGESESGDAAVATRAA